MTKDVVKLHNLLYETVHGFRREIVHNMVLSEPNYTTMTPCDVNKMCEKYFGYVCVIQDIYAELKDLSNNV